MAGNEDCSGGLPRSPRTTPFLSTEIRKRLLYVAATPYQSHILPWAHCFYRENLKNPLYFS